MSPQEIEQGSLDDELESAFDDSLVDDTTEEIEATDEPEAGEIETAPEEAAETVEELEPLAAPPRWSNEAKKAFNSWNGVEGGREYQEAMLDMYGSTQKYTTQKEQEAAHFRKAAEDWDSIFQPYQQQMNLQGTNGPTFMKQLIGYYQQLQQNPAATIQQLAKSYNLDLANIGAEQPYMSPAEQANAQRIAMLENAYQQNLVQARETAINTIQQQIQSFADELDASGNPAHPHFEQVQTLMTQVINGGIATDLGQAYIEACKLHPDVATQAVAKKGADEIARKAASAKKARIAAKRPQGKHSGTHSEVTSIDDELSAAYDEQAA